MMPGRIICCISGMKECDGLNLISRFVSDGCTLAISNEHLVKTVYVLINLDGDESPSARERSWKSSLANLQHSQLNASLNWLQLELRLIETRLCYFDDDPPFRHPTILSIQPLHRKWSTSCLYHHYHLIITESNQVKPKSGKDEKAGCEITTDKQTESQRPGNSKDT
ncbi:uncharacterized protein Dyak_GE28011 [Drosophila yakuba]|uniref:Uncharacterized protein n=1 Tax=Drosophila yakuba TaxID=7245 RepID=A0A0R1DMX0_DROYA|nr:uncharacterized protein Dyak_GE28011 [Drosophila yakuba]